MEDSIEVILQDQNSKLLHRYHDNQILTLVTGAIFSGVYGLWAMFCMPGLKVPLRLKVPFLPSTNVQTENVMKMLDGRQGQLADLGSGDGRLVFAACAAGFQCRGFEINSMLVAYSRGRAWWRGLLHSKATFVNQDFWKTDLSKYTNVIAFLAPAVMQDLEEKLLKELPGDARVVVCRFPFPRWPHSCTTGTGLDQVFAACAAGFQCRGFEINSMLVAYSRGRAWWRGLLHSKATFVNQDFWKTDLSKYTNVIAFLAPAVMQDLEEKLLKELPGDARVVVCRFPFPRWPHSCTTGTGLDQVWAYDVYKARHRANTSSLKPQG